ncbi:MAG TPA: PAS domain-containing protein [Ktedonobacterales bacterium]|nr:PAS domain-containing protein [Ktedonobacterales bacterium]
MDEHAREHGAEEAARAPIPPETPGRPREWTSLRPLAPNRRGHSPHRRTRIGRGAALTGLMRVPRAGGPVGPLLPHLAPAGLRHYTVADLARLRLMVKRLGTRPLARGLLAAPRASGAPRPEPAEDSTGHQTPTRPTSPPEATDPAGLAGTSASTPADAEGAHLRAELARLRAQVETERARWQTAMDEVSTLVLACDATFHVTYINRAFQQVLGPAPDAAASPADWVAHYAFQRPDGAAPFPPEAFPIVRALRERRSVRDVLLLRQAPDGIARLTSWDASPVFGPDGAVLGCVAIGRDVTAERRRVQREACLMAVARAAAGAPDPAAFAARVRQVLAALATHAGVPVVTASLQLLDRETNSLRRTSVFGVNPASRPALPLDDPQSRALVAQSHYSAGDGQAPFWYDRDQREQWASVGIHAWATVPLRVRGATLGALSIGLGTPHVWDSAERAWIEACADAVALAHENDHLFAAERRRTEELEAVVQGVDLGIVLVAPDGRVLVSNAAATALVGPPPGTHEIQRIPIAYAVRDAATGEPVPPDRTVVARALRGETVRDVVRLMRDTHQRERVINCSAVPVRDASGQVAAAIVTFGDVTVRTRQRDLTEQLFARLGMALEPAEEMRELVNALVDTDGMATAAVYTAAADGQRLELLVARNYPPEVATLVERIPIGAPSIAALALRTHRPEIVQSWDDVLGDEHALTRQLAEQLGAGSGIAVPLLARGAVVGVLVATAAQSGAFTPDEVSLLLGLAGRAGLALVNARLYQTARTTAAQLDAIINGMAEGVWVCDAHGQITLLNAAAAGLMSLPPDQLPASLDEFGSINQPHWPDGRPMALEDTPLRRGLRGEVSTEFEANLRQATTGQEVTLRLSYAPLRDETTGAIIGAVSVGRDITPLRELERSRQEFLAIVSHELKTPLTSLMGFLQLIRRRRALAARMAPDDAAPDDATPEGESLVAAAHAKESEQLERIDHQAHRLDRLVNDLLDVARLQRARVEYRWAVVDVVGAIAEAVDEQRTAHPTRQITFVVPDEALLGRIDADRVGQVVTNLLTNALKYSRAEQPVVVTVAAATDELTGARVALVRVRDRGQGIPAEHREHVFESFYRVPGIEVQSGSGIGLGAGLYVAREIVERHGGHIAVEDTSGPGATIAFTLPLGDAARA